MTSPARIPLCRLLALTGLAAAGPAAAAGTTELAPIEIIGTTPLPGIGLPREQIPGNVQTLGSEGLQPGGASSLAEKMQRDLPSVNVNEIQGNPYQTDLNYRGFTASPLLGTPQGLSVFVDGLRVNEGFGDVVNWDLIPQTAIASMTLVPGSNPLYGLNTLGGALALQTKRGDTHPGGSAEVYGGRFGRLGGAIEQGGRREELSWYLAGEGLQEDGWRDHSNTRIGNLFAKLAWTTAQTDVALTLDHANTDLIGNGLLPESMQAVRREAVFTYPDHTRNRSNLVALSASHWLGDEDQVSATLYLRRTRTRTLNGDLNDEFAEEFEAWADAGFPAGGEPDQAALNRSATDQHADGVALQWSHLAGIHQFAFGLGQDRSRSDFLQTAQAGELAADRGVLASADEEAVNRLIGHSRTTSAYLTDSIAVDPTLQLTASLRFNHTRIENSDRIGDALNGDFSYEKLNPALGLTWKPAASLGVYAGFTQGNRAPTPIELGCADPENACSLPNAITADPFLEQVVTRTWELGLRGRLAGGVQWNAGAFRSTNYDDIQFVGTSGSLGFFTNFGRTRREGLEVGLAGSTGPFEWRVNYNYLQASYQSPACLLAEHNSTAGGGGCDDGQIRIEAGDRLPGLPQHALKLALDWQAGEALRIGADLNAYSNQYVRGNENNRHQPDADFGGRGKVGGYAVLNLDADYRMGGGWTLFARIDNVFDKHYASAGALAANPFTGDDLAFVADPAAARSEQFVAPGAPRSAVVGVRLRWGGKG